MTTVILWRHGQTAWNLVNRFQGHTDIPLDEIGAEQARSAARVLTRLEPDVIVSSDLVRARRTAEILAEPAEMPVVTDPSLREADAGRWEGLTRAEIDEHYPGGLARWAADAHLPAGITGETRAQVGARVGAAIQRHVERAGEDATVVVVTHGGAARSGTGHLLGWPATTWTTLRVMDNCAWAVLRRTPARWQLVAYNRTVAGA